MDLEQSIHFAQSVELSIVQGETIRWTAFKVEVEGHSLEFTAFGDLPLKLNVFDDQPIANLTEYLAELGAKLDAARERTRKAEAACEQLREELAGAEDHGKYQESSIADLTADLKSALGGDE